MKLKIGSSFEEHKKVKLVNVVNVRKNIWSVKKTLNKKILIT